MSWDHHEQFLDLRREDVDPEVFSALMAVRHVRQLLAYGGSAFARSDDEPALQQKHLEPFLARTVEMAKKTQRFEYEWRRMQRVMLRLAIDYRSASVLDER